MHRLRARRTLVLKAISSACKCCSRVETKGILDVIDIIVVDKAEVGDAGPLGGMSYRRAISANRRHAGSLSGERRSHAPEFRESEEEMEEDVRGTVGRHGEPAGQLSAVSLSGIQAPNLTTPISDGDL